MRVSQVSKFLIWITLTGQTSAASLLHLRSTSSISKDRISSLSATFTQPIRSAFPSSCSFRNLSQTAQQTAAPMHHFLSYSSLYLPALEVFSFCTSFELEASKVGGISSTSAELGLSINFFVATGVGSAMGGSL